MGTDYFNGGGPAKIRAEQLPAVFQRDIKIGQTVALINNVFNAYYTAYHAMDQATVRFAGTRASRPLNDLRDKVLADLRDAAQESSMINIRVPIFGVRMGGAGQSLQSIFTDLNDHGALKNDEWDGNGAIKAPAGIFAFQAQMLARGAEVARCQADFNRWQAGITTWRQNQSWESLGDNLDRAGKVIDLAGPKMWAAFGCSTERAGDLNATAVKWWSMGATVKGFLDSYIAVKSSPNQQRQLVAEVAAFVVSKVPVFGSAYAGVIQALPKAMTFFEDYARRNEQAINALYAR
jgi:hypothetical protein